MAADAVKPEHDAATAEDAGLALHSREATIVVIDE